MPAAKQERSVNYPQDFLGIGCVVWTILVLAGLSVLVAHADHRRRLRELDSPQGPGP